MPRWVRVARGMIGTGITFAAGVGTTVAAVGTLALLLSEITPLEVLQVVAKFSAVSFLLGVAFSGVLAVTARGRAFGQLSLRRVSAVGAGAGLLYFLFLAVNGGRNWAPEIALANFAVLLLMGAGAASAMLLVARRASRASATADSSDPAPALGRGAAPYADARQREVETTSRS